MSHPAYRFYNTVSDSHFYTVDAAERDNVAATLPNFRYEGVAFYEPKAGTSAPTLNAAHHTHREPQIRPAVRWRP
jgi:lysyl endopeptidase